MMTTSDAVPARSTTLTRTRPAPARADGLETVSPIPTFTEPAPSPAPGNTQVVPRVRSEPIDRAMNVLIATIGLVVTSPVIVLFAGIVKLTSRGPVFYSQARVGIDRRRRRDDSGMYDRRRRDLGGRAFNIFKFRSMYTNAEQPTGAVWATKSDPRVTAVGRVMRKFRIDELPQLVNVLRGDMNIVGPRPERPSIFSKLSQDIAGYPERQRAKPGITGWAQINQAYDTSLDDVRSKVRYDLEYLQRQGVAEDLKIMARTLPVMIFRKGGW